MPPYAPPAATERLCHHLAQLPPGIPLDPAALAAAAQTTPAHAAHILAALRAEHILAPDPCLTVRDPRTLARLAASA